MVGALAGKKKERTMVLGGRRRGEGGGGIGEGKGEGRSGGFCRPLN